MEHLKNEQLMLLQQNLTYETYEKFVSMFEQDEKIPEDPEERKKYIIEAMKNHEFWGEIHGWGDSRVYKHIPKYNESRLCCGPYGIFSYNIGNTKKELIKYLDGFRDLFPFDTSNGFEDCLPVEEETFQVPMFERWKNDSMT